MKTIAYISHTLNSHDERFLEAICSEFAQVHLVTVRRSELPKWIKEYKNLKIHNLYNPRIPFDDPDEERYPSFWFRLKLSLCLHYYRWKVHDLVQKLKPDLVHGFWVPLDGYLAASTRIKPLVIATFVTDVVRKPLVSRRLRERIGWTLQQADQIISDCIWVRDKILEFYPFLRKEKFTIFPRGVELNIFFPRPRDRSEKNRVPTVICPRSLELIYDHETLFDALDQLDQSLVYKLVLAGGGSLQDQYNKRINASNWSHRVTLLGQLSKKEMAKALRDSEIYVSCSKQDGISVSLLEGMASGLAVVVSDLEGNREILGPGEGEFFNVGDSQRLAEILERLIGSPEQRESLSQKALSKIRRDGDWENHRKTLINVYRKLLF